MLAIRAGGLSLAAGARAGMTGDAMGESDGAAEVGGPAWREARAALIRYLDRGGGPADLDTAVERLRAVVGPGPDARIERDALVRLLLGVLLVVRVLPEGLLRSGTPTFELAMRLFTSWSPPGADSASDLDEGICHLTNASEDALLSEEMHTLARGLLGTALIFRGMSNGGGTDMERALGLMSEAMTAGLPTGKAFTTGEGLKLPDLMRALVGLTAAGNAPGAADPARLETALDALGQAREGLAGHPLGDYLTGAFGETLARRAYLTGRFADFGTAWEHISGALEKLEHDDHLLHDHLVYDELLRTLAGVTVSHTAHTFDHGRIDELVRLSGRVLERPGDDPRDEGRDRFLAGMAMALRALRDRSRDDEAAAIGHLRRAAERIPPDDPLMASVVGLLGGLLFDRHGREGGLQDSAAAGVYFDIITRALKESRANGEVLDPTTEAAVLGMGTYARAVHGWRTGDAGELDAARGELRSLAELIPADHPWHPRVRTSLGVTLIVHARLNGGTPEEIGEGLGILAEEAETAAAPLAGAEVVDTPAADLSGLLARGGCALAALAVLSGDGPDADARLDRGVQLLELSLDDRLTRRSELPGARLQWALGTVLLLRYDRRRVQGDERAAQDLGAGIARLERSRELSADRPGDPSRTACLQRLALLYRDMADTDRAIEAGMEALRAHADDVLLQTTSEGALTVARGAAELSQAMAGWCLGEGRHEDAVAALELGRGLVLHAATESRDLPEVLDGLGETDLAARWRAEQSKSPAAPWDGGVTGLRAADGPSTQLFGEILGMEPPDDLRARTLETLPGRLRTAPSAVAIAQAVRALGSDALAYLLRDSGGTAGRALVVRANGTVSSVELPRLDASGDGPLAEFVEAEAALDPDDPNDGPANARRDAALESLCDWAGEAVRPLVEHALSWSLAQREPRLTLVPCGVLGLVPWHAAALAPDGSRRVLHDLVVTYGASGRQLIDVAGREAVDPYRNPVFVANPSGEFFWNASVVKDLRRHYYPGSLRYGRPRGSAEGAGTAEEVLRWLPGAAAERPERAPASLIQFGCHALAMRPAARSYLELAGGERLEVSDVLRQARRSGTGAGGGMVILCACSSDHTEVDHDEALTPATAFVAGGAVTVLGARWAVRDSRAALLAFMYHHHLREGRAPADALRLAQLWMLDPRRRPPSPMSALLTDRVSDEGLADIASWGSFALQGRGR
ncbi:CHAT domain-containing protein [Actinomadura rugatobispora]|uniref:CHAT domain-containing protein n=1 Tax=Actinomadura rugatobispora TaxID=1994 RepID=A0ABW0ZT80_9ACTN|nr:hypothetical protein GCM10010200_024830 [Actinomadura rugatobispora]